MFEFLRRKHHVARPIFEPLGIDIHCHLVPSVDDGSKSEEETVACLSVMRDAGFHKVICTPHFQYPRYPNEEEDIKQRFAMLRSGIAKQGGVEGIELVGIGGEYRVDSGFPARMEAGKFLLVGGKYLLCEFSLHQQVMGLDEALFDLQMKGYEIILAHPERYPYYSANSSRLEHFKEMGIYFQINALSLSGFYGDSPRSKAFDMVEKGWVEFIGTDMHNTLYAHALLDATYDHKIEKMLAHHTFMNNELLNIDATPSAKF